MESLRKRKKLWRLGAEGENKMAFSVKIEARVKKLCHSHPDFFNLFLLLPSFAVMH